MENEDRVKCAARYCRNAALPAKKYCEKHEPMTGCEMVADMRAASSYTLTQKQAQFLIDYGIAKLSEDAQ